MKFFKNKDFTLLKLAQQNGKQLLKLVNSILDFSKLEAGKLELEEKPVVLYDFFTRQLGLYESNAQYHGIEMEFEYESACWHIALQFEFANRFAFEY